jgi:hypothetical protein
MKVIAVITDRHQARRIVEYLKRNKAPPFDKVALGPPDFHLPGSVYTRKVTFSIGKSSWK